MTKHTSSVNGARSGNEASSISPQLRLFDLTMVVVSLVIGMGIFRTPQVVAQSAGSPSGFILAWIVGGFVSICGALTFAEIGSRLPRVGGFYKLFSEILHPLPAFMIVWALVVMNVASSVAVALVGAEYLSKILFPFGVPSESTIPIIAFGELATLFALNYLGIRVGASTQNLLSGSKIALMSALLIIPMFSADYFTSTYETMLSIGSQSITNLPAIGIALISVFFTFGGYQQTLNFGGDIRNAHSVIPRATILGMLIVLALYLGLNAGYLAALGFEGVKSSPLVAASLAEHFFGPIGTKLASSVIFISVMGYLNTAFVSNSRVYHAMAMDGLLPKKFLDVHPKKQVQEFALIVIISSMVVTLIFFRSFESILNWVMFIDTLALALAAATIFVLRRKQRIDGSNNHGYSMKLYPVVPAVFIVVILWVNYSVLVSRTEESLYGIGLIVLGAPLYYLTRFLMADRSASRR